MPNCSFYHCDVILLNNSVKGKLTKHPTAIMVVATVLTLVLFSVVYFAIESLGKSERSASHDIRNLDSLKGRIEFYGEVLTNSALMAAVTGNESWSSRFVEHRVLLDDAQSELRRLLGNKDGVTSLTENATYKLLEYESDAFELIQQNRADEARHMLFGPAYQLEKSRHELAMNTLASHVDAYIQNTNSGIENARDWTQRFVIVTLLIVLCGWFFVLLLIHWWQQEIRQLAYYDSLTGLASRRYFTLELDKAIKLADRRRESLTLLYMDLDGFKDVNDSMGHDVGDYLLKEIANRLSSTARQSDFVTRLGGDEFCILLQGNAGIVDVEKIVERYLQAIEQPVELSTRQFRPRTSIGVSRYPEDGTTAQSLMKSADSAMYSAKKTGKHTHEYYNSELTVQAQQRLTLVGDLREAFLRDEFLLHYQPIVNLNSGCIESVEALVRWQHPDRGLVPPLEFISQLETMGLIDKLGEWVLERACTEAINWTFQGKPIQIAVNISPKHFHEKGFVESVRNIIDRTGMAPNRIIVEITESTFQNAMSMDEKCIDLRRLGISLAIDDFGTGYSSLGSLRNMPIDILKIDRIFVQELLNDSRDSVMLSAIMGMARGFDLSVVVEGVEETQQVLACKSLGCDRAQGYYFSRPVIACEMARLLEIGKPLYEIGELGSVKKAS